MNKSCSAGNPAVISSSYLLVSLVVTDGDNTATTLTSAVSQNRMFKTFHNTLFLLPFLLICKYHFFFLLYICTLVIHIHMYQKA